MPKIPAPVLSLLKIQVTHIVKDVERDLGFTLGELFCFPNKLIEKIERAFEKAITGISEYDIAKEVEKAMANFTDEYNRWEKKLEDEIYANALDLQKKYNQNMTILTNQEKIFYIENILIPVAKKIDAMSILAFNSKPAGYDHIKFDIPKFTVFEECTQYNIESKKFYFPIELRSTSVGSRADIEYFKKQVDTLISLNTTISINKSTWKYSGNIRNTDSVNLYALKMVSIFNMRIVYDKMIENIRLLVQKARIIIDNVFKKIDLIVRIINTIISVIQDVFNQASTTLGNSLNVGPLGPSIGLLFP